MATEPRHPTHEQFSAPHENQTAAPRRDAAADRQNAERQRDADKQALAKEREERQKATAEREKHRGTPTPTQEEIDLIKLGHHVELANDGSGPDPNEKLNTVRHIGGKPPGEYNTRSMQAK